MGEKSFLGQSVKIKGERTDVRSVLYSQKRRGCLGEHRSQSPGDTVGGISTVLGIYAAADWELAMALGTRAGETRHYKPQHMHVSAYPNFLLSK